MADTPTKLAAAGGNGFSPYVAFSREEWARLRAATPLTLSEADLATLRGINDRVSLDEVVDIYLPLSRLLNLYVVAVQGLSKVTDTFLGKPIERIPYVIGVAGSVAVGKSTTSRILQALLSRWPTHPRVELITTDSFLHPNHLLSRRGLMSRKGFPESYDLRRLLGFMVDLKSGVAEIEVPVYSHLVYDIVADQAQRIERPDIVIVEGLNVLQSSAGGSRRRLPAFVSDFFDFSIYVDAEEADIEAWYVERFLTLRETAFRDPDSFFRRYGDLEAEEAVSIAHSIWTEINGRNLRENILPTRERARLVLVKGSDHAIRRVRLRKI